MTNCCGIQVVRGYESNLAALWTGMNRFGRDNNSLALTLFDRGHLSPSKVFDEKGM